MSQRTDEEKRQAVLFAALYEYQAQRFFARDPHGKRVEIPMPHGDITDDLPPGVEPELQSTRRRWEYWRSVLPPNWSDAQVDAYQLKHWCGAFTLFSLKESGLAPDAYWLDGVGYCFPQGLKIVTAPQPGDIAWFQRNSHYALVHSVYHESGTFVSIDGNQGLTLSSPSIKIRRRPIKSAYYFFSIAKFLEQAQ